MENLLEARVKHLLGSIGLSPELGNGLIDACFRDVFSVALNARMTAAEHVIEGIVRPSGTLVNLEEFTRKNLLLEKKFELEEVAHDTRQGILTNADSLSFVVAYTDPTPGTYKTVRFVHDRAIPTDNLRQRKLIFQNAVVGAGLPAIATTGLGFYEYVTSHPVINLSQQGIFWTVGVLYSLVAGKIAYKIFKGHRKEFSKERELGREIITEDELVLPEKYSEFKPIKTDPYTGQYEKYDLRLNGKVKLNEWNLKYPSKPIFHVALSDPNPSPVVGFVEFRATIDGKKLEMCRAKGIEQLAEVEEKTVERIDNRYFRVFKESTF